VPASVAVDVAQRTHAVTVDVELVEGDRGVLLALGSVLGGWSLHVLDGRLRYVHNLYGKERHEVVATEAVPGGRHELRFAFEKTTTLGGTATLTYDGRTVGQGEIARFTLSQFNGTGAGLTCGYELGPAVGTGYAAPFAFTGTIHTATVEVADRGDVDPVALFQAIMATE